MVETLPSLFDEADLTGEFSKPLGVLQALSETGAMESLPDWLAVEMLWMAVCLGHNRASEPAGQDTLRQLEQSSLWKQAVAFDENCPLIDARYLLKQGIELNNHCLTEFLIHPESKDIPPNALFDTGFYHSMVSPKINNHPLVIYFRYSSGHWDKPRNPNVYFDVDWYRRIYLATQSLRHPLLHYFDNENFLTVQPSAHFDNAYVRRSLNLAKDVEPLGYYLENLASGKAEFYSHGFSPCAYFDREYYQARHPDIKEAAENGKLDPFFHFFIAGINEARLGHPWLRHDMFVPGQMPSFQSKRRTAVIILGMHRSGTSAITRAINLLGMDLPSQLMEANFANEAGYWESDELARKYHDPMLAAFNSAWDDILPIDEKFYGSEDWHRFRAALSHYVVKEFHDSDGFVLKDPRMCKLARLWLEALADLNVELKVIIPFRNPFEVAGSLAQRDGFSLEKSLLLWAGHVLATEKETRGTPRCFISYEQLLGRPLQVVRQAAEQCRIEWPNHSDSILSDVEASIDPKLCHQRFSSIAQNGADVPDWVDTIYQTLEGLTANAYDADCIRKLDEAGEFVKQMNRFIAAVLAEKNHTHHNEMSSYRQKNDLIMQHALAIQKLVDKSSWI